MGTEIRLTMAEIRRAAAVGVERLTCSLAKGYSRDKYAPESQGDLWARNLGGACAELAFAKSINVHWAGQVDDGKRPDVGPYQVRYTQLPHGRLRVRENDSPDEPFVLVVGIVPDFKVCGYVLGGDAMRDEWLEPGSTVYKSWLVPQDRLLPIPPKGIEPCGFNRILFQGKEHPSS